MERFWSKVNKTKTCWLWIGSMTSLGYGQLYHNKTTVSAHRIAYELCKGSIPKGLTIDHLCRVRHCVNPEHLEAVTGKENTLRGVGPSAINAKKTHCPQGHPYSGNNLYIHPKRKSRMCRICRSHWDRRYNISGKRKNRRKSND